MISRIRLSALALPVLLAACAEPGIVPYLPPSPVDTSSVALSADASASTVATQLRDAGYSVSNVGGSRIEAVSSDNSTVDCGVITQVTFGNVAEFAGNAPSAVMYVSTDPIVITQREVDVATRAVVTLADGQALIEETSDVTMSWTRVDETRAGAVTERVLAGRLTAFPDGTSCTISGKTASILR